MPLFKTNIFYSFLFDQTGQACVGFGWSSTTINVKLSAILNFVNCYKNLITNVGKIEKEFIGNKAKLFDQCTDNNFTPFTISEYTLSYNINDQALFGGTTADGRGCW